MPKATKKKKTQRHDPLEKQILADAETGTFRAAKPAKADKDDEVDPKVIPSTMTKKILKHAVDQISEIQSEQRPEPNITAVRLANADQSDSDEELDLNDVLEDVEISLEDEAALSMFMPTSQPVRRTLADIIMEKIKEKEQGAQSADLDKAFKAKLDPQVVKVYTEVGRFLSHYTSGKIPKAFKIIPTLRNWEDILVLTDIEKWSPQAMFAATRLFASSLNPKMAQRFYNLVLLPRLRMDIETHKRLNYHLYQSIKKAIYKPAAFFRGLLLPLAEESCSVQEAVIICSVLSKCSIPAIHSAVALLKLAQLEYSGPVVLIMRTLLNKKYSLPYKVIDSLVKYFSAFERDSRNLPVVWHQNLLTFVQRYKNELTDKQKTALKNVTRKQVHHIMSAEIRRELNAQTPIDLTTGLPQGRAAREEDADMEC